MCLEQRRSKNEKKQSLVTYVTVCNIGYQAFFEHFLILDRNKIAFNVYFKKISEEKLSATDMSKENI